jgi:hypothetical protein
MHRKKKRMGSDGINIQMYHTSMFFIKAGRIRNCKRPLKPFTTA